jgi:hypothetical protein
MDQYELTQISDALKTSTFNSGDYVIKEGEMGDIFYIIEEGEAIATKTFEPGMFLIIKANNLRKLTVMEKVITSENLRLSKENQEQLI